MKNRTHWYIIGGVALAVLVILAMLNLVAAKPNEKLHGFARTYLSELQKEKVLNLPTHAKDISGFSEGKYYLTTLEPNTLFVLDQQLNTIQTLSLNIDNSVKLKSNYKILVDSGIAYIFASNVPAIIKYDLNTDSSKTFNLKRGYLRPVKITRNTFAFRSFDSSFKDKEFRKINLESNSYTDENGVTEKTGEGGMSTDGMLNYDRATGTIIYTHFYCNRLIKMDTNLKLITTGRAIDTFGRFLAKGASTQKLKGTSTTFAAPPTLVNSFATVHNGILYVLSKIKGDNERTEFAGHATIDLYSISEFQYLGSISVPNENKRTAVKFAVYDNKILALYPNSIVKYNFNLNALLQ